jgi:hypothetical protein
MRKSNRRITKNRKTKYRKTKYRIKGGRGGGNENGGIPAKEHYAEIKTNLNEMTSLMSRIQNETDEAKRNELQAQYDSLMNKQHMLMRRKIIY